MLFTKKLKIWPPAQRAERINIIGEEVANKYGFKIVVSAKEASSIPTIGVWLSDIRKIIDRQMESDSNNHSVFMLWYHLPYVLS